MIKLDDFVAYTPVNEADNDKMACKSLRARMYPRINKVHFTIARILSLMGDDMGKYYIAGNSCNAGIPNDYDIYPAVDGQFNFDCDYENWPKDFEVICTTKNAMTVKTEVGILQFCKYFKPSLKDLVESFDFAHIKLGICVDYEISNFNDMYIKTAYVSPDWHQAMLNGYSFYTNPDAVTAYPLSSLLRINKYIARGDFKYGFYKAEVLKILTAFVTRGFKNYEDFKDQLAAVDLLLLDPSESNAAWQLWLACCSSGLVKDKSNCPGSLLEFLTDIKADIEELEADE